MTPEERARAVTDDVGPHWRYVAPDLVDRFEALIAAIRAAEADMRERCARAVEGAAVYTTCECRREIARQIRALE